MSESSTPKTDDFMARMKDASAAYVANDNWYDFAGNLEREVARLHGLLGAANNALGHQASETKMSDKRRTIEQYFLNLRMDPKHHLGLGDIRLTLGQQYEILEMAEREVARLREALEESIKLWNPHCAECGGFGCHTLEPIRCKTMDRQDAIRAALKGKP